ncbi:SDR family NAD(P)-dependent oxidoreductase [Microbispora siamensis]
MPLGCWYYATKHALVAYSDSLRMEVEQFGVEVVIIQPGIIKTGFEDHTAQDLREISGATAYGAMAEAMARRSETQLGVDSQASDPGVVAAAIREAVEAGKPQTRYAVGWMPTNCSNSTGRCRTASSTSSSPAPSGSRTPFAVHHCPAGRPERMTSITPRLAPGTTALPRASR